MIKKRIKKTEINKLIIISVVQKKQTNVKVLIGNNMLP
jgi:hypothetical protein